MIAKRKDLQVLRGFAVLLVLFYHLKLPGFYNGFLGVDLFFVLSGFLMANIYSPNNIKIFYIRRLKRILPAYFVTIAVTTFLVALITIPTDADQRFERIWYDIFGSSNFIFFAQESYFGPRYFKPLLNLWSLGIELQFYLILPILFLLLKNRIWLLLFIFLFSIISSFIFITFSPKTSFFLLPFRLWEFLLGIFVAWYPLRFQNFKYKNILIYLIVIIFFILMFFYPVDLGKEFNIFYSNQGLVLIFITILTALIISLSMDSILNYDSVGVKFFSKIGDYSYSIYLVHYPIIVLINYTEFGGTIIGYKSIENLVLILFLTFLSSYLLFNYIEKLRFSKNSNLWILVILVAVILAGLVSPKINNSKYTNEQIKIFEAWNDRDVFRCGKIWKLFNYSKNICSISESIRDNKVLLLGDSTADAIKKSFSKEMELSKITTYFYSFNSPLSYEAASAEIILAEVLENNINSVVVLFSSYFYRDKKNIEELKLLKKKLEENDIKIMIISPIPANNFHVPKKMYEKTKNPETVISLNNIENHKQRNETFFKKVNKKIFNKKNIFWSYLYLCIQSCQIDQNGKPLYFDSGHLTLTGSIRLEPLFNKIAKQIQN